MRVSAGSFAPQYSASRYEGAATRSDLLSINNKLDVLVRDRQDEVARRQGSKATLDWIKWGVSVLAVVVLLGGTLGLWQVRSQWEAVQQQLQKIPSLP